MEDEGLDEINDSPVEEVRLTVPITDDKTLPVLTFRTWVLGLTSCILLAFLSRYLDYRQNPVIITAECIQILTLFAGKLMAETLPAKSIRVPGTRWWFSMNPGAFNIKEHVLITILASSGSNAPTSVTVMTIVKVFYHREYSPLVALLLGQISMLIGFGYAGIFMKFFVDSPKMWWPSSVAQVPFYRALHEADTRIRGKVTRLQFFVIVSVASFAYYIVPNYFFPSISALSFVCLIWKNSVTAQQIGSGLRGLGLGSIALDYTTICNFVGNPLTSPPFSIINSMVGFVLFLYVIVPIAYWTNSQNAKRFPLFSSHLFDADGRQYNVSRVLDEKSLSLDRQKYNSYSQVYLSVLYAYKYAFAYACVTAILTHVILYHGRSAWNQFIETYRDRRRQEGDIHNRLMSKYRTIPQWWFCTVIILSVVISIPSLVIFKQQLQLPVLGLFFAIITSIMSTFCEAVFQATANQGFDSIAGIQDLIIAYILPGRPLALETFRAYNRVSMLQALYLLSNLKLGHYLKIPPRSIFIIQVVGEVITSFIHVGVGWWLLSTIKNICEPDKLPKGSPWTCPIEHVVFDGTVQSGVVGPSLLFFPHGLYWWTYIFFAVGIIATVAAWKLSRVFPHKKWIQGISVPILLSTPSLMPPATPAYVWAWAGLGIFFNIYVFRKHKKWWAKYNYVLSAALNVGPAFLILLQSFAFQGNDIYGVNWWGLEFGDHCPLATCPTAKGIVIEGCPVFH
ncbi:hypothetical protein AAC387_Pa03g2898 [Persea americana]